MWNFLLLRHLDVWPRFLCCLTEALCFLSPHLFSSFFPLVILHPSANVWLSISLVHLLCSRHLVPGVSGAVEQGEEEWAAVRMIQQWRKCWSPHEVFLRVEHSHTVPETSVSDTFSSLFRFAWNNNKAVSLARLYPNRAIN